VEARAQIAMEFLPEEEAKKKKCFYGKQGWDLGQHPDYQLPRPFRPAQFSIFNPVPFVNYQIANAVQGLSWTLSTFLLPFPFLPMLFQFLWNTPWWWYFMAGVAGLVVMIRIVLVDAARAAKIAAREEEAAQLRVGHEEEVQRVADAWAGCGRLGVLRAAEEEGCRGGSCQKSAYR